MGKLFGGQGLTTPTGVEQNGSTQFYKTPEEAATVAKVASAVPSQMYDPGNVNINPPTPAPISADPNAPLPQQAPDAGAINLESKTQPATTVKPSFLQAASDPKTGLPNATSPSLTKGGKLLTLLTAGAKGALAGTGAPTLGGGFQAGVNAPFQAVRQGQELQAGKADVALKESQVQMLPWQRAQLMATLGKTQAETGKYTAETKASNAKAILDESEANAKKYLKGEDGVIYDISGKSPVPAQGQGNQFIPADAEMVKVNPNLKLGQPLPIATATKLKTLANSGIETITAGGRVRTVNKATNEVIKDWGAATPLVTWNMGNPLGNATATPGTTGEDAIKKLSPAQQTLIRGIAHYEIDPNATRTRGVSPAQAIILAKQYNPDYDQTQYGTKTGIRKDFTTGTSGKLIRNINTATGHLDQLNQASDLLDPSQFPALNKIANTLGFQVGSDKMTNFNTIKNAVVGELSSIYKGTGAATDAEIEHVGQTVMAANSPEQLKGFISQSIHLMNSRLEALGFQYENGIGAPADFQVISPSSQKVFQKYGANTQPFNQRPTSGPGVKPPPAKNPLEQKYQQQIPGIVFPGASQ